MTMTGGGTAYRPSLSLIGGGRGAQNNPKEILLNYLACIGTTPTLPRTATTQGRIVAFYRDASAIQPPSIEYLQQCCLSIAQFDFGEMRDRKTLPIPTEPETVEIHLNLAADAMDFSLLDEREREFAKDFIGAFKPHPDFTTSDLLDDGY